MSKFRTSILIVGMLVIIVAASLLTVLALYATGSVVTDKIELVYSVYDEEKVYDGTPLVPGHYELVSGDMLKGHYAVVEFEGSQTDAGESKSGLSVKICDENGYDVTREYKIGVQRGNLKVLPKDISIVLNDEEVTYNGTKVSFEDYTVTEGELVAGHKIAGSQNAQLITVNDVLPSDLKPLVFDAVGQDVTKNYNVSFTMGRIRVVPRPVSVKPADIIKVYDGAEVSVGAVQILAGSLAEGQYFKNIEINNGITKYEPDVCDRVTRITKLAIYQRVGSNEIEVTENYDLDLSETGVVRIEKRILTITAKSKSWEYDGGEHDLVDDHAPLSYEGLATGEQLISVDYSGRIKDAGTAENKIASAKIYSTIWGTDVSLDNYEIIGIDGTLTVTKRNITIITPTVTSIYDGTELKGASDKDKPMGVNLLPEHILEYDEENLPSLTEYGTKPNEFACTIVDKDDLTKKDLSENYNITYYYGSINVNKRVMHVLTPTISEPYDGVIHYGYDSIDDIQTDNLLEGHRIVDMGGQEIPGRTDVGRTLNIFNVSVCDAENKDVSKNYEIDYQYGYIEITRLNVTIKTKGATQEYDGNKLERNGDYTDYGDLPETLKAVLRDGQKYPSLEGVTPVPVENKVLYKLTKDGVDVDEKNYKIVYEYGWLQITPCVVNLKLNDLSKPFDKNKFDINPERALDGNDNLPDEDLLPKTAIILEIIKGEAINAGTYAYTAKLAEGYAANFDLRVTDGTITIDKYEWSVTLPRWEKGVSEEYVYNGNSHKPTAAKVVSTDNLPLSGYIAYTDLDIETQGISMVNASDDPYYYSLVIVSDEKARNIDLICTRGSLKINKCIVDVTLKDYDEDYNAKVWTPDWDEDVTLECASAGVKDNPQKYFELYTSGTVKDAGVYTYGIRFIYRDDQINFDLQIHNEEEVGHYKVKKIDASIEYYGANTKIYDGKAYTVEKPVIEVIATTKFIFDYSVNCQTSGSDADKYTLRLGANNVFITYMGENISHNFKFTNEKEVSFEIERRAISFALDNFTCKAGSAPRYVTQEIKECLHVSNATPLLNGFYISFDDDVINYVPDRGTLTVEDFDYIEIFNENGKNVTHNFYVTNEDRLTASVITFE